MALCICGEEIKNPKNAAHLKGALHRCGLSRKEVEGRGFDYAAPIVLTNGAFVPVLKMLDAENVVDFFYEYRKGGPGRAHSEHIRRVTTERIALAILTYGARDARALALHNPLSKHLKEPFADRLLKATLLMQSLYGDDATEVFWKYAMQEGEERGIIRTVLLANGVPFTDGEWDDFASSYCLEALILAESARLKQIDEALAVAA